MPPKEAEMPNMEDALEVIELRTVWEERVSLGYAE